MKWQLIPKERRNYEWHVVPAPAEYNVKEARLWCNEHPSDGRYYCHYTNTRWWFENRDDAAMFVLTWGSQ